MRKNCQSFRNLCRESRTLRHSCKEPEACKDLPGQQKGTELNPAQGQLGHMAQRGLTFVGFLSLLEPGWQESSSKQKLPHAWQSLGVGEAEICASLFFNTQGESDSARVSSRSVPKGFSESEKGSLLLDGLVNPQGV